MQVESVGGYAGAARCFRLVPPFNGHSYVTICVTPSFGPAVGPEVGVFPAEERGACVLPSMKRHPGSFVLHDEPDSPEKLDGAYAFALLMIGDYRIGDAGPVDAPVDE